LTAQRLDVVLLDVRTPEEFEHGHVPGALSFPLGNLDVSLLVDGKIVSRDRPVYLICHTQNRSRIAAERFIAAGLTQALFVSGGTAGWIDAGFPVTRDGSKEQNLYRNPSADGATA
jgi:rhodanese-related sulfurtransferase